MRDIPLTELRQQELRDKAKARRNNPNPNPGKYEPFGGEKETYISPNFGDGGWHTTPGCLEFVTEWEPRNDRILVRITEEVQAKTSLHIPESARTIRSLSRIGTVLKCGPGKWIPGEWWKVRKRDGGLLYEAWEWFPGHREEMIIKPGMKVLVGQFDDWSAMDAGWENVILCQEADVRAIL